MYEKVPDEEEDLEPLLEQNDEQAGPSPSVTPLHRHTRKDPASTGTCEGIAGFLCLAIWFYGIYLMMANSPLYTLRPQEAAARVQAGMRPEQNVAVEQLRIGTFNIRYDGNSAYPVPIPPSLAARHPHPTGTGNMWGEKPWSERRWKVADAVLWEDLDVVGFQEALMNQVEDLEVLLGDQYACVGVGRDDGKKRGEYVPIYYKKDRLELISVRHFWLSETPTVAGSVSWDAGQTRMATVAEFQDKRLCATNFYALNTHWDDRGVRARAESAKVILKEVRKITESAGGSPLVILMGDLNSPSSEEGYQGLTGHLYSTRKRQYSFNMPSDLTTFCDTRHELSLARPYSKGHSGTPRLHSPFGDLNTFTGFSQGDTQGVIDFVMVLDNGAVRSRSQEGTGEWRVSRYGVVPNRFEDETGGMLVSDHRLVVASLERV